MRRLLLLVTCALLLAFNACERKPSDGRDNSTIKIGYYGDLSGPTLNFGKSALNGVLMAVDEINEAGGVNGRKLDVVIEDDQGNAELAATRAGKLIDNDKVIAIIAGGTASWHSNDIWNTRLRRMVFRLPAKPSEIPTHHRAAPPLRSTRGSITTSYCDCSPARWRKASTATTSRG